jgi:hypothetical protein
MNFCNFLIFIIELFSKFNIIKYLNIFLILIKIIILYDHN